MMPKCSGPTSCTRGWRTPRGFCRNFAARDWDVLTECLDRIRTASTKRLWVSQVSIMGSPVICYLKPHTRGDVRTISRGELFDAIDAVGIEGEVALDGRHGGIGVFV